MDSVGIHGLDETVRALRALPAALSGKGGGPIRRALFKAAKMMREDARARVPVYRGPPSAWVTPGLLRDSISTFRDRSPAPGVAEHYTIAPRRLSKKNYVNNKFNRRARRVGKTYSDLGPTYYAHFIEFSTSHSPAHPFMRPAFEANKVKTVDVFAKALAADVAKVARQVAARP